MRERTVKYLAAVGALLILSGPPLQAQGQDTALAAKHRNDCRLASQVLTTGHPHPHREWALGFISSCGTEGPSALALQWETAGGTETELEQLVRSSARLRDARLYRQVRGIAEDRSRPASLRVGAMLVLSRYTDPRNAIWLTDLVPPDPIRRIPLVGSSASHFSQVDGAEPVGPVANEVLAVLDEIVGSRDSETPHVWYAAAVLARRLRRDMERGFAH